MQMAGTNISDYCDIDESRFCAMHVSYPTRWRSLCRFAVSDDGEIVAFTIFPIVVDL